MNQLSPSPIDRILELKDEAEKLKVELTSEVKAYIQTHLDVVQGKLSRGEDVMEDDMKFIDEVRLWVAMPKVWRREYPSIEAMIGEQKIMRNHSEAQERYISLLQWLDLLHVAKAAGKPKEWIDQQFRFPGEGQILVERGLYLDHCTGLTSLPENLSVRQRLSLLYCTGLTSLPKSLSVGGDLILVACTGLTRLPKSLSVGGDLSLAACTGLTRLPKNFSVGGDLFLTSCTGLTSLPENLSVGRDLSLESCTNLKSLPENLSVKRDLNILACAKLMSLPKSLSVGGDLIYTPKRLEKDASSLKMTGKIKGVIAYAYE